MAFRDEEAALRSRLEAADAENRRLLAENAALAAAAGGGRPEVRTGRVAWALVAAAVLFGAAAWCAAYLLGGREQETLGAVLASFAVILLTVAGLLWMVSRLLVVVAPGEALVVSGRTTRGASGELRGYRVVTGGRVLCVPFIERVDRMDLTPMPLEVVLHRVPVRRGELSSITLRGSARIAGAEPLLGHAIERFLGRSHDEIAAVATETVTGAARGVLAMLTVEEVREDALRAVEQIRAESEMELERTGLMLERLHIIDVQEGR